VNYTQLGNNDVVILKGNKHQSAFETAALDKFSGLIGIGIAF